MRYPEDSQRFATAMNWLAEKFPKQDAPRVLTKSDLADMFTALKGIGIDALEFGARWHFQNRQFFPKPPELIEASRLYRSEAKQIPDHTVDVVEADRKGQYAKDAIEGLELMRSDAPIADKVQFLENMERAYPGLGWGDGLEKFQIGVEKIQAANAERYQQLKELRQQQD